MKVPKQRLPLLAKRTLREFLEDDCLDLAAALTYYSVLAIFPAIVALTALLGTGYGCNCHRAACCCLPGLHFFIRNAPRSDVQPRDTACRLRHDTAGHANRAALDERWVRGGCGDGKICGETNVLD